MLVKPDKVDFSFARYSDPKVDLTETDLDRIAPAAKTGQVPDEPKDGQFLALRLSFALPTSSYATMALRELMKNSTSVKTHMLMTRADAKDVAEGAI